MDCREVRRALRRRFDGEAPGTTREELDLHLASCRTCARAARVDEAVRAWFAARPRPAAPEGLTARVLDRIHSPEGRLLTLEPMLRAVAAAAAVLLLATGAALFLAPSHPGASHPVSVTSDGPLDTLLGKIAEEHAPPVPEENGR